MPFNFSALSNPLNNNSFLFLHLILNGDLVISKKLFNLYLSITSHIVLKLDSPILSYVSLTAIALKYSSFNIRYTNKVAIKSDLEDALETIATELGLPVTGTILVGSEGQAKKLKLAEQGYKPFLPYMMEQIKEPANWAKLVGSINRMPTIDFAQMRQAEDYGYFGILGHHASKVSPFWMKFVNEFADSPVTLDVLNFVAAAQKKENEAGQPQILNVLNTLSLRVNSSGIDTSSYSPLNYYDVQRAFREKYPSFEYFDRRKLKESMESNQDLAITFIRQALQLDEVLSKSMNAIELVANDF